MNLLTNSGLLYCKKRF